VKTFYVQATETLSGNFEVEAEDEKAAHEAANEEFSSDILTHQETDFEITDEEPRPGPHIVKETLTHLSTAHIQESDVGWLNDPANELPGLYSLQQPGEDHTDGWLLLVADIGNDQALLAAPVSIRCLVLHLRKLGVHWLRISPIGDTHDLLPQWQW